MTVVNHWRAEAENLAPPPPCSLPGKTLQCFWVFAESAFSPWSSAEQRGPFDDNPSQTISAAGEDSTVGRSYLYLGNVVSGLTHHFVLPAGSRSIMMQSTRSPTQQKGLLGAQVGY